MKVATFSIGGERRVGIVDPGHKTVSPFDLPLDDAARGVLALVRRDGALPATTSPIPLDRVTLEAPVPRPDRNIFCVGKNYHEHAQEFARSGFDSSAVNGAVPKHPIIFSKVPETVIANGAPIVIDPKVSTAIDYEAELAVIIGKEGRGIRPEDAMHHVWGYTIVNDVTARDLQGRHSQWLIGKSQDSFCPMGPWAVTRDEIDISDAAIRCFVNGDIRQSSNTRLLIFDILTIIAAISEGLTLKAGDIIATGTPAGVGIGFDPPRYLKKGDVVRVEIDGIGALENRVDEVRPMTSVAVGGIVAEVEGDGFPVVMIHGLGGTSNMFQPQMEALRSYRVIRVDLPGSGRSPVPAEMPTFEGFAEQVVGVAKLLGVTQAHFVGHSMGTIVCQMVAAAMPDVVRSMTLFGALAEPAEATRKGLGARAQLARNEGMLPIAEQIVAGALSASTRSTQPVTVAFVRESIMRQNPEGYARTCEALATARAADARLISAPTLLLTGSHDAVNPPSVAEALRGKITGASLSLIGGAGHWLPVEKPAECNQRIADFLKRVAQ